MWIFHNSCVKNNSHSEIAAGVLRASNVRRLVAWKRSPPPRWFIPSDWGGGTIDGRGAGTDEVRAPSRPPLRKYRQETFAQRIVAGFSVTAA